MITKEDIQALRQKQAERDALFDKCDALVLDLKQRNDRLIIKLKVMSAYLSKIIELKG
jgi:hypothetical protein